MASQGRRRRPLRRPETVVPGEATETDSEPSVSSSEEELYLGPSGPTRGRPTGLRVAGEAAETDSDPEPEPTAAPRDLPPLVVQRELAEEAWGAEEWLHGRTTGVTVANFAGGLEIFEVIEAELQGLEIEMLVNNVACCMRRDA
ncbi:PREDICTED: biogenesis of lysosome-related organelles complex 1 subunit 3 [Colobus angolensis palliatus]|uniref:biogenesis of lysosome-related organelles complex 1 subunit 3 n=1 Tax=Colobus angolensis palliatus TaxID=336983 RepID=UPI0005F434DB|nr:PREDICTED: biogenesis of lysosome-related organelles complex 1 subunit 3 [Colobus angolensis palliatus]